jgi:subtilisin-like proprotein convertase family protein
LTNLNATALGNAWKSVLPGGTESVVFTNAVIGDVYYIGVKSEDQEAAEFSLIGVSSDRPFEEERNGRIYLYGVPFEAAVLDGTPRRPTAGTMLAIGLSNRRIAHAQVTTSTLHENFPDLVGVLAKQQTRIILNNHAFGTNNSGTNTFVYEDNPMFAVPGITQPSDGPGSLNELVGYKIVGPWFLEMIDNSPSHTGRVQRFEVAIDPLRDDLQINGTISGTVEAGEMAFWALDVPPGATNINFSFTDVTGTLEFYWREELLPTTNSYDFTRVINPPGAVFSLPVTPGRTYYMGLRNPTASDVSFTLTITAQFADVNYNRFFSERTLEDVRDVATTNSVIDVAEDKLVSDVRVGVRMKHPRSSDVALTLISPQGSRILLAENRGFTNNAGFGSNVILTNRSTNGSTIVTTQASYVIFTDRTNLTQVPVKFANPGSSNSLGSVGVAFASGFELSTLAGNYQAGTTLSGGWRVTGGGTNANPQVSVLNIPGLSHTGDTFLSLGTAGVRNQFQLTPGRAYTLRFYARRGALMDFYSTGVDDLSVPIAAGIADRHYYSIPGVLPMFVLPTNEPPFLPPVSWTPNGGAPASQWITPYPTVPTNDLTGLFLFRTYINLYEQDPATFHLTRQFRWSGDDVGSNIRVNGRTLNPPLPGTPSSNFFGGTTMVLPPLEPGLNIVDFFVNDASGAEGLRVQVNPTAPYTKRAQPEVLATIGGVTRRLQVAPDWGLQEFTFVPSGSTESLILENGNGEVWVDTISVESSGDVFLHPEEPFELLEGERAMGEWRLEVRDTRTGAVLPTSEVLEWSLELAFADTRNPAVQMQPGDVMGPITLGDEEVLWVVLDPCQAATFARFTVRGIGNADELLVFADHNGFPTGHPELDDFIPIANDGPNGTAVLELSTLLPAPARLTGKPVFVAIINQFLDTTNQFEIEFESDGNCSISGPPPVLNPDNPTVGSVEPDPNGGSTNTNEGVFQFTVPPNARAATVTVTSDGDVTLYGQKDAVPTTSVFTYRVNATPGPGTESLRIDQLSAPALSPGLYYVRIGNNTAQRVNFTATVTFGFDNGSNQLSMNMIITSTGELQLQFFPAEVGAVYVIEATSDLTGAWTVVQTITAVSTLETHPITPSLTQQYQFFRVRKQ